ncbi:hypothetical protein M0R72_20620 [Candidatus Pacearchaeota archaeon]|jgi:hypothetical protein|nr:hypothetical protein [Candidatus Pacearchaeota archaeon]
MKRFYIDGEEYNAYYEGEKLRGCKGVSEFSRFLYCIDCPMPCTAFLAAKEIAT